MVTPPEGPGHVFFVSGCPSMAQVTQEIAVTAAGTVSSPGWQ